MKFFEKIFILQKYITKKKIVDLKNSCHIQR